MPLRPQEKKSRHLQKSQVARRASFLRRKLRDWIFRDEPVEPWFRCMVGCSRDALREHLEKQLVDGMTWATHGVGKGKWSIDHIQPCASFRLGEFTEDCRCFNWKNLRPMWFSENSSKGKG